MAEIGKDILKAKQLLENQELVAIPTETVYGLAGNAFDPEAVLKIFQVKNRPDFDPLITHTDSIEKIKKYVKDIPQKALLLAEAFWPGPLTLLLNKNELVPDVVTSGLPTVAVRIPNHELTLSLLKTLPFPLAAPSANPFGYISPTTAKHVEDQLGSKIPYILNGGSCNIGLESTIVGFEDEEPIIYRLGGLELEKIEKVIGKVKQVSVSSSNPKAPGMLKSHYAPRKSFFIGDLKELVNKYDLSKAALLSFNSFYDQVAADKQVRLTDTASVNEAAKNLFAALRYLDALEVDFILGEFVPDTGLGRAINDRLRRAAAK